MLTIEARAPGRTRTPVPSWQIPLDDFAGSGAPLTLRELIEAVVAAEVRAFRERQAERRLIRFLTAEQIGGQLERGRVDFGGRDDAEAATVDDHHAAATALESFEDGLYLVLIDGRQYEDLDEPVQVAPDSHVTFLRLVALAGG
jgi:hypothetical protein